MNFLLEGLKASFLPILILLFVYFYIVRPEQKKRKKSSNIINTLSLQEKIVTKDGVIGTVKKINAPYIFIETGSRQGRSTEITADIECIREVLK